MVNKSVNNSSDELHNGASGGGGGCDIHSSIKEVTSAIVHYCSERAPRSISPRPNNDDGSRKSSTYGSTSENLAMRRSASPRKAQLWLESSFVGSRPIDDSPETPGLPPIPPIQSGGRGSLTIPPTTLPSAPTAQPELIGTSPISGAQPTLPSSSSSSQKYDNTYNKDATGSSIVRGESDVA